MKHGPPKRGKMPSEEGGETHLLKKSPMYHESSATQYERNRGTVPLVTSPGRKANGEKLRTLGNS